MKRKRLETIYAEISWYHDPWETVRLVTRNKERIFTNDGKYRQVSSFNPLDNPAQKNPHFWRDLREWSFAFVNKDSKKILGYYRLYGQLRVIPEDEKFDFYGYEFGLRSYEDSWKYSQQALSWFQLLTCIVDWLKNEKIGPLWELFGEPRTVNHSWIDLNPMLDENFLYSLAYRPRDLLGETIEDPSSNERYLSPQNDNQLIKAAWDLVVEEVKIMMNEIELSPTTGIYSNTPNLTWQFKANGPFQAAFLQWYFQELADVSIEKCSKAGCDKHVPPNRKKYCSKQCYAAAAKQRQREKAREV